MGNWSKYPGRKIGLLPAAMVVGAILSLAGDSIAFATVQFASSVSHYCGSNARVVTTGDFNLDGHLDISVGLNGGSIGVLLGHGDGTFDSVVTYTASGHVWGLAVADFNNDGWPDIAAADDTANEIVLFQNEGNGAFGSPAHFSTGDNTNPQSITAADFDGDGNMDAAAGMRMLEGGHFKIFMGDGEGSFGAPTGYPVTGGVQGITSADLDHDGDVDIATANYVSGSVSVFLNEGDGAFGPEANYDSIPGNQSGTFFVIGADLNGDGNLDLAAVNAGNNNVSVFLGSGDGAFGPAAQYPSGDKNDRSVAADDFDRNGRVDLVLANLITNNVISVLPGNGGGTFGPAQNYVAQSQPHSVAVADFDEDGRTDVVAANYGGTGVVSIFRNVSVLPPTFSTPAASAVGYAVLILLLGGSGLRFIQRGTSQRSPLD
jgi:hypothetical protein